MAASLLRSDARPSTFTDEDVNCGRVHADQTACADPANDDGLDSFETVDAHNLCVGEDGDATPYPHAGSAQRPAKAL